jgi:hypothetical protein
VVTTSTTVPPSTAATTSTTLATSGTIAPLSDTTPITTPSSSTPNDALTDEALTDDALTDDALTDDGSTAESGARSSINLKSQRPGTHVVGQISALCFSGYQFPILAEVVDADGGVRRKQIDEDPLRRGNAVWYWVSLPGEPEGVYSVSVYGHDAQASFRVVAATDEAWSVYVRDGNDLDAQDAAGSPGSIVGVALAGFVSGSLVDVHFYGPQESQPCITEKCPTATYAYISTVAVPVDDRGQAVYEFVSAPDSIGRYCVLVAESGFTSDAVQEGLCLPRSGVFTLG